MSLGYIDRLGVSITKCSEYLLCLQLYGVLVKMMCTPTKGDKMTRLFLISCLLLLTLRTAHAQQAKCSGPQIGTWKLMTYTREETTTGVKTDLLGAHPTGYLSYNSECRMHAILMADGRKAPATVPPTDQERIGLYNSMIAYAGTYDIDGSNVHHHVDTAWNQTWVGSTQSRQFRIDGKTLYIKTFPAKSAMDGKESTVVLVWSKVD